MVVLDLFCGGGGAAEGFIEAGLEVVGVDSDGSHGKRYPGLFVRDDAFRFIREFSLKGFRLRFCVAALSAIFVGDRALSLQA